MKELVTGSKGFIASHYLDLYPDSATYDIEGDNKHIDYDEVDRIIHLGALTNALHSITAPSLYWSTNVTRAIKLYEENMCKPFFFASSAAVYKPLNPYALTKCVVEDYLKDKPNVSIGRFFNVFGEGDKKSAIYLFINAALWHEDIYIYGNATRDFIYVKDLVLNIKHDGVTKDIGYGQSRTVLDVAKMIISLTKSRSKIIMDVKKCGDPQETLPAKNDIEVKYGFEEGLARTIAWVNR